MRKSELAELAEISIETVKRVERMKPITIDTLVRIVNALETTLFHVLKDEWRNSYIERFAILVDGKSDKEKDYILSLIKKIIETNDSFNL